MQKNRNHKRKMLTLKIVSSSIVYEEKVAKQAAALKTAANSNILMIFHSFSSIESFKIENIMVSEHWSLLLLGILRVRLKFHNSHNFAFFNSIAWQFWKRVTFRPKLFSVWMWWSDLWIMLSSKIIFLEFHLKLLLFFFEHGQLSNLVSF